MKNWILFILFEEDFVFNLAFHFDHAWNCSCESRASNNLWFTIICDDTANPRRRIRHKLKQRMIKTATIKLKCSSFQIQCYCLFLFETSFKNFWFRKFVWCIINTLFQDFSDAHNLIHLNLLYYYMTNKCSLYAWLLLKFRWICWP